MAFHSFGLAGALFQVFPGQLIARRLSQLGVAVCLGTSSGKVNDPKWFAILVQVPEWGILESKRRLVCRLC